MSRLYVGAGISRKPSLWAKGLSESGRIMLASEPRVYRLHGKRVADALRREGFSVSIHLLPEGEKAKAWSPVAGLLGAMLEAGLGRDAGLVALGGGALTDAAGFAAAIFMRGIAWASLPTTLLGQLDGGLGGKTAINLPQGKNLAGAFHMPESAVCDTGFLSTLPRRERLSGLAEAVKCGLVFDPPLWDYIRSNWRRLLDGEPAALERVVRSGAGWKMRIVRRDERERKGERELLNFGHTLGHALEKACGFGRLRHGEAVFWGMRAAVRLSVGQAGLSPSAASAVDDFLSAVPLPPLSRVSPTRLLQAARLDKKARGGSPRFVLLRRLGRPVVKDGIAEASLREVIEPLLKP